MFSSEERSNGSTEAVARDYRRSGGEGLSGKAAKVRRIVTTQIRKN